MAKGVPLDVMQFLKGQASCRGRLALRASFDPSTKEVDTVSVQWTHRWANSHTRPG